MMKEAFDLVEWCGAVEVAAGGVVNPALLPAERRKFERELAKLTTPEKCLCVSLMTRDVIKALQTAENELKREREKERPVENS